LPPEPLLGGEPLEVLRCGIRTPSLMRASFGSRGNTVEEDMRKKYEEREDFVYLEDTS
jgi:hypothetical protein